MDWTVTVDAIEKDPTNANIIVTMTITNGADVKVTDRIPGNDITPEFLAGLAATRIAVYQAREDAILALTTGVITPVPFVPDPEQVAFQALALAQQKAALLAPSDDADVQAAQAAVQAAINTKLAQPPVRLSL